MIKQMPNHKSAKKRTIQSIKKNINNSRYLSQIRTHLNKFEFSVKENNKEDVKKYFQDINSIMAKAVKKGLIKKKYMSRKLSSLSNQIQKN